MAEQVVTIQHIYTHFPASVEVASYLITVILAQVNPTLSYTPEGRNKKD